MSAMRKAIILSAVVVSIQLLVGCVEYFFTIQPTEAVFADTFSAGVLVFLVRAMFQLKSAYVPGHVVHPSFIMMPFFIGAIGFLSGYWLRAPDAPTVVKIIIIVFYLALLVFIFLDETSDYLCTEEGSIAQESNQLNALLFVLGVPQVIFAGFALFAIIR